MNQTEMHARVRTAERRAAQLELLMGEYMSLMTWLEETTCAMAFAASLEETWRQRAEEQQNNKETT